MARDLDPYKLSSPRIFLVRMLVFLGVAGCVIAHGRIVKGKVRVMRRKALVYEGVTQSLRRFQDEVNEVRAGMECGIRIEGYSEFQVGDTIECYAIEKVAAKL